MNLILITITQTSIRHCQSAWKPGEFRVLPGFGPGGGAQRKCDPRNINPSVNNECTDVFRRLDTDFGSSSPAVQAKTINNISSMIRRSIHSTGIDPAMAQLNNDQCSFDEDFIDYVLEELIEQPSNSFNHLSSFVAATEASLQFSASLPAIARSSQPVPCSNSNNNSNDITNMTSFENMGFVSGSTIVEGAMSLGR